RFVEVAPESTDAGALGRTYTAQSNETPQAIAKRFDALARARWAAELKEANPERDWTARIYAGDVLAVPEAWPQPFWSAAKERGFLETSGPTGTRAADPADPFLELRAPGRRQGTFAGGQVS
ncbi:MAG: LysM domain-containing protein, partial [Byssovorax sp.]